MACHVKVPVAERRLLEFVGELLASWPPWIESAAGAMRRAVDEAAARIPEALKADEARLAELDGLVENLVDQLAVGGSESPAVRRRLDRHDREAEASPGRRSRG
jgi:hypothetical protein